MNAVNESTPSVQLNHTIVWARDRDASAAFLAGILGLAPGAPMGPFIPLRLGNDITLDYAQADGEVSGQHYAFLVADAVFDAALDRIRAAAVPYWADPSHRQPGTINHHAGGRGFYFADPDGHNMELLTRA